MLPYPTAIQYSEELVCFEVDLMRGAKKAWFEWTTCKIADVCLGFMMLDVLELIRLGRFAGLICMDG